MVNNLSKFWSLSREGRALLLGALVLLPVFWLLLRLLGYHRFSGLVSARVRQRPLAGLRMDVDDIARYVNAAARQVPIGYDCLTRSMLLLWLLGRQGKVGQLWIGVRLDGCRMDAHAWVEWEGRVVNDHPSVRSKFAPLLGAPRASHQWSGSI